MSTFDVILIIVLGLSAVKGYQQGLVVEVFSFLAFFIGFYVALKLTIPVTTSLFGSSSLFSLAMIVVFIVLFILIVLGVRVAAKLIKTALNVTLLGIIDNLLGAVIGILKWAFILSVVFWVFSSAGVNIIERYVDHTLIFPFISDIGPAAFEQIGNLFPFIEELIEDLKNLPINEI